MQSVNPMCMYWTSPGHWVSNAAFWSSLQLQPTSVCKDVPLLWCASHFSCQVVSNISYGTLRRACVAARNDLAGKVNLLCRQQGRTEEEHPFTSTLMSNPISKSLWIPDKPQAVHGVWSQLMLSSVAEETELLFARGRVGLSNPPEISGGNSRSEIWAWESAGTLREQQHKREQPS